MTIYVCTMLALCFLSLLEEVKLNRNNRLVHGIVEIIAFGMPVLMTIFRCTSSDGNLVGVDLVNYEIQFNNVNDSDFLGLFRTWHSDIGYVILNWVIGRFTRNFHTFVAIVGVLSWIPLIWGIKKYSCNVSMSLAILLALGEFNRLFNVMRQGLAMSILFFAAIQLAKGHRIQYLVFQLLAMSIHSTAIIGVLYCLVVATKSKKSYYLKVVALGASFLAITLIGIPFLVSLYKTNDYSDLIVGGEGEKLLFMVAMVVFLCYIRRRNERYSINNMDQFAYNSCMVAVVVQILALGFSLLTRLMNYFSLFFIILIPNTVRREGEDRAFISLCALSMGFLYYCYNLSIDLSGIVPYGFC